MKILVAYDGSECSEKALRDMRAAGMPERAEVVVLTVADRFMEQFLPDVTPGYPYLIPQAEAIKDPSELTLNEAKAEARKAQASLKRYFPLWEIRTETLAAAAGWGVIERIESLNPDLVVMGSHGRSQIGRILFGSVSHQVLSHAHCNLRVCRAREGRNVGDPPGPLRILVAYDGSEESEIAFEAAISRCWPKGTTIRLVTVVNTRLSLAFLRPTAPIRFWIKGTDTDPKAWIGRMLSDHKMRIEEMGFSASAEAIDGDPRRVLLKEAEAWGADTVFAGSRGLTGSQRVISGSVSTALAMQAHCSVEIVHRSWDAKTCCQNARVEHRECMARVPGA